jgi:hypothetical protein
MLFRCRFGGVRGGDESSEEEREEVLEDDRDILKGTQDGRSRAIYMKTRCQKETSQDATRGTRSIRVSFRRPAEVFMRTCGW